jgi:prepilin-type N-terminal cleavage/methylation domain-containing protein
MKKDQKAFTMIEILVVIGIIGILASLAFVYLGGATKKARDTKRISDLTQIGRFLSFGCLTPDAGAGEYDLNELLGEYRTKYPQYASNIPSIRDPKTGNESASGYRYIVTDDSKCVLYANLENGATAVTLSAIAEATPGGGKGVFVAVDTGPNGSNKFFQVSN